MALFCRATGNFTASSTWGSDDATSRSNSESGTTAVTTSLQYCTAFTPGAITVDALAVKISSISGSPTGTVTIGLYLNTGSTLVRSVTLNVSDLPLNGFVQVLFSSSAALSAATAYKVGVTSSSASQVTLFTDGTTANWTRFLRTTTQAAPAAADTVFVLGEYTGAGAYNAYTVTMNETATTTYGNGSTSLPSVTVGGRGTLVYGTSASTNYYLKVNGLVGVHSQGVMKIGDSGTRIPSTSTATLEFVTSTTAGQGIVVSSGGEFYAYGDNARTPWVSLTANLAASGTSITHTAKSGWAVSDSLVLAPTGTTDTHYEIVTISGLTSSTQTAVSAATNAHSGTSPTQAEVGNLTRNVTIKGQSQSTTGYWYATVAGSGILNLDYVSLLYVGSTNANKLGLTWNNTSNDVTVNGCVAYLHASNSSNSRIFTFNHSAGLNFTNNVLYGSGVANASSVTVATTVTGGNVDTNLFIDCGGQSNGGIQILSSSVTFSGNHGANCGGVTLNGTGTTSPNCNGLVLHNGAGLLLGSATARYSDTAIYNNSFYQCGNTGAVIINMARSNPTWVNTIGSLNIYNGSGIVFESSSGLVHSRWKFKDIYMDQAVNSGSTGTISISTASTVTTLTGILFENCTFNNATGVSTADISLATSGNQVDITFNGCKLGSSTLVAGSGSGTGMRWDSRLNFINCTSGFVGYGQKRDYGEIKRDSSIKKSGSYSTRLTPVSDSVKLESTVFRAPVASGTTPTINVPVRCSVLGDGAAYNGSVRPRLIVKSNYALGILGDTVLDTATAASDGAWETLTGTLSSTASAGIVEFYIDCQGTAGWVNVDDIAIS